LFTSKEFHINLGLIDLGPSRDCETLSPIIPVSLIGNIGFISYFGQLSTS